MLSALLLAVILGQTAGPWNATVVSVHDGDTITVQVALGFDVYTRQSIRIEGIDAPELRVNDPRGIAARDYLAALVPVGSPVRLKTPPGQPRSFTRYVGSVTFGDKPYDVAASMLAAGHATPYPPKP